MAVVNINESKKLISHTINNRLNTLALGMGYLEDTVSEEERIVIQTLKVELRDLQALIEQLKHHN
ncbi:MAG: hypothetical protein Phog2KO_38690 [Phototrophicaceae bacterium]